MILNYQEASPFQKHLECFSLYLDALVFRTDSHSKIVKFDENSSIPIVNALSDFEHPTQIISDIFTIVEHFKTKPLNKIKNSICR